jgi:hypothetical protein
MQNVKMKISHPRFLIPGDSPNLDIEFPQCLRKHVQSDNNVVLSEGTKGNFKSLLFAFPQVRWFKAVSCFILIRSALFICFYKIDIHFLSGHQNSRRGHILLAYLVSCCYSWKLLALLVSLLWNGEYHRHSISHITHALQCGGKLAILVLGFMLMI